MPVEFSDGFFEVAQSLSPKTERGTRIRSGKNPLASDGFRIQDGFEEAAVGDQNVEDIVKDKVDRVKLFKSVKGSDVSPGGKARLARYVTYTYMSDGQVLKEFRVTPDGEPIKIKGQKERLSKRAAEQEVERYRKNGAEVDSSTSDTDAQDSNKAKRERDRNEKKPKRKDPKTTSVTVGRPIRDSSGQLAFDPREPRTVELPGDELAIRSDDLETSNEKLKRTSRSRPRPESDRAERGRREKPKTIRKVKEGQTLPAGKKTEYSRVRALPPTSVTSNLGVKRTNRGLASPNRKRDPLGRDPKKLRKRSKQDPVVRVAAAQMKVDKQIEIQQQRLAELERSPGTYSRGKGEFDETARDRKNQDAALKDEDLGRREGRGGSGGRGFVANSTQSQRVGQGEKRRIQNRIAQLQANKEALEIISEVQAGDFSRAGNVESLDDVMRQVDLDESQDLPFDDDDLQKPRSRGGGAMSRTGMHPAVAPGTTASKFKAARRGAFMSERDVDRMGLGEEDPLNRQFASQREEAVRAASAPERILGAGNPRGTGNPIEMIDPQGRQLLAGTGKADQESIRLTQMLKQLSEGRERGEELTRLGMGGLARFEAGGRNKQNMVKELFRMLSGSVADTGLDKDEALKILSRIIRGGRG